MQCCSSESLMTMTTVLKVRESFSVLYSGRGRLSARGNGRAIGVVTDEDGYARANFTPLDGGTITVRASADWCYVSVTFTITTGSASSASGARDSGTGGTPAR